MIWRKKKYGREKYQISHSILRILVVGTTPQVSHNNEVQRSIPRKCIEEIAPLSGPLVIAEAPGEKKSLLSKRLAPSTRAATFSAQKKNKYLLKRREHARSFSDQDSKSSLVLPSSPPSPTETLALEAASQSCGYVLQKREVQLEGVSNSDELRPPSATTEAVPAVVGVVEKLATECQDSEGVRHVDAMVKRLKVKKHSYGDADSSAGSGKEELKKKKKVGVRADHPTASGGDEPQGRAVSVPVVNRTSKVGKMIWRKKKYVQEKYQTSHSVLRILVVGTTPQINHNNEVQRLIPRKCIVYGRNCTVVGSSCNRRSSGREEKFA